MRKENTWLRARKGGIYVQCLPSWALPSFVVEREHGKCAVVLLTRAGTSSITQAFQTSIDFQHNTANLKCSKCQESLRNMKSLRKWNLKAAFWILLENDITLQFPLQTWTALKRETRLTLGKRKSESLTLSLLFSLSDTELLREILSPFSSATFSTYLLEERKTRKENNNNKKNIPLIFHYLGLFPVDFGQLMIEPNV